MDFSSQLPRTEHSSGPGTPLVLVCVSAFNLHCPLRWSPHCTDALSKMAKVLQLIDGMAKALSRLIQKPVS